MGLFTAQANAWEGRYESAILGNCSRYKFADAITMDEDLEKLTREDLIAQLKKLRQGIRNHRDCTGHELCWHHPELWGLLPDQTDPIPAVPAWPEFIRGCVSYRQSLDEQAPGAPRTKEDYNP
jgi:hypothetical protein